MTFFQVPHEKRPKNVFGFFDNGNASATFGHKLARILQTLKAFIVKIMYLCKKSLMPKETLKCLFFNDANFILKNHSKQSIFRFKVVISGCLSLSRKYERALPYKRHCQTAATISYYYVFNE